MIFKEESLSVNELKQRINATIEEVFISKSHGKRFYFQLSWDFDIERSWNFNLHDVQMSLK